MRVSEILQEIKSLPVQQRWEILERTRFRDHGAMNPDELFGYLGVEKSRGHLAHHPAERRG